MASPLLTFGEYFQWFAKVPYAQYSDPALSCCIDAEGGDPNNNGVLRVKVIGGGGGGGDATAANQDAQIAQLQAVIDQGAIGGLPNTISVFDDNCNTSLINISNNGATSVNQNAQTTELQLIRAASLQTVQYSQPNLLEVVKIVPGTPYNQSAGNRSILFAIDEVTGLQVTTFTVSVPTFLEYPFKLMAIGNIMHFIAGVAFTIKFATNINVARTITNTGLNNILLYIVNSA
jgi:hypothetical protein